MCSPKADTSSKDGHAWLRFLSAEIRINYETIGSSGPWIAFTPGSRRPYEELIGLSKAIARSGYRILLHDRRNCGRIGKSHSMVPRRSTKYGPDDLYALGQELGALPM
jgi:pimeloyl-ACP methyl ester carboxylesterase